MLQQALQKLQKEISDNPKAGYVRKIGAFLITYVRENPQHADKIVAEGKTIKGSLTELIKAAEKDQANGCGVLDDEEGFEIALKYFGVEVPKAAPEPVAAGFSVSLDDLL